MAKCSGLGICEAVAPDFFEIGDDGGLLVLTHEVGPDQHAEVEEAIRSCPTQAIGLVEDTNNE
ncbi:ferredoxin [Rhodococcus sp. APC 3903]|uniref:ferredoxin n=1 Tax=Rhodococcus sp. APC 3903 TaxID=3035193 RepID=UPI0025B4A2BC|nr:ferredoxin [Rhodococcus sp. APC 3903]MDN3459921.1 ferredoxin [Rhodococcus sp. APC 3903]